MNTYLVIDSLTGRVVKVIVANDLVLPTLLPGETFQTINRKGYTIKRVMAEWAATGKDLDKEIDKVFQA